MKRKNIQKLQKLISFVVREQADWLKIYERELKYLVNNKDKVTKEIEKNNKLAQELNEKGTNGILLDDNGKTIGVCSPVWERDYKHEVSQAKKEISNYKKLCSEDEAVKIIIERVRNYDGF